MAGLAETILDQHRRLGMHGNEADLVAFTADPEVQDTAPELQIPDLQPTELLPPQPVVQQHGQDGPVPPALERVGERSLQEAPRLVDGQRRGLALVGLLLGPRHALDRVVGDRVLVAEVVEDGGEGRELPPDGRRGQGASLQILALGDDVGAGHGAEFLGPLDTDERGEVSQIVLVGPAGARILDVGEPLEFGRDPGQPLEFGPGEEAGLGGGRRGRGRHEGGGGGLVVGHGGDGPVGEG